MFSIRNFSLWLTKQRVPQFRRRNWRSSEKERFFKVLKGNRNKKIITEIPGVITSFFLFHEFFKLISSQPSPLPPAHHPPAAGQSSGLQSRAVSGSWGETTAQPQTAGTERHRVWKKLCSSEGQKTPWASPTRGLWQYSYAVPAEMEALAWRKNLSAAALALVTRRHWLPGLFIQPTAVAQSAASQRKVV